MDKKTEREKALEALSAHSDDGVDSVRGAILDILWACRDETIFKVRDAIQLVKNSEGASPLSEVERLQRELDESQTTLASVRKELTAARDKIKTVEDERDIAFDKAHRAEKKDSRQLHSHVADLNRKIGLLQQARDDQQKSYAKLRNDHETLEAKYTIVTSNCASAQRDRDNNAEKYVEVYDENKLLQKTNTEQAVELEGLRAELESLRAAQSSGVDTDQIQALRTKIARLEEERLMALATRDAAESAIASLEKQLARTRDERDASRMVVKRLQKESKNGTQD